MPNENLTEPSARSLERRVERLTAAVAVLATGFALAVVWVLVPRQELTASHFTLRDANGSRRGALEIRDDGSPIIRLNDVSGRAMLYGAVLPDGSPRFRLADSAGLSRVVLEIHPGGVPHAQLLDANGRTGVDAWLEADGRPELNLRWGRTARNLTLADSTGGGPASR
jgi:hypothetical protein